MNKTKRTLKKFRTRLLILGILAVALQYIPGRYTFQDVSDDFDADSPEGVLLAGVAEAEVSAELYFARPTVQRISRNAELGVPGGATVRLRARTRPRVDPETGEVRVVPEDVEILSDLPLTFIYRNVPLARARVLRSDPGDPESRIRAYGRYRILSALPRLHRYERRRDGPRRVWEAPDRATVQFSATLHSGHTFSFSKGVHFTVGEEEATLRLSDLLFEDGRWLEGRFSLETEISEPLSFSPEVGFREVEGGHLTLSGRLEPPGDKERARLALLGELRMHSARFAGEKERESFSGRLQDWETRLEGTLIVNEDGKLDGDGLRAYSRHVFRDLSYESPRDSLRLPFLDLRDPALGFELRDDFRGGTLRMAEPLDIRGINWTRARRRETLRIEEGRLRMNPFSFDLAFGREGIRGEGAGLSGLLEAWAVSLRRGEEERVTLTDPVRLDLQADRITMVRGEIMIEGAQVRGAAGRLHGQRKELRAVVTEAEMALTADRQSDENFQYAGTVTARGGATVQLPKRDDLPDLELFLQAGPVGISGDQDIFRVRVPTLRVSIPLSVIREVVDQIIADNRERIRDETAEEISVGVDVRRVRNLAFFENRAVMVVEGRVYTLGDRIHTAFSAEFTLDFLPPENVHIRDARLGFAATLTGISLSRVNPRIERLILRRVPRPLFEDDRALLDLVPELPEDLLIDHVRFRTEEERLLLLIALQEGSEIEFE